MTPASTCSDAALTRMVAFRSAFPNLQARARADLMTFRNLAGVVDQLRTFGRTDAGRQGGGMRRAASPMLSSRRLRERPHARAHRGGDRGEDEAQGRHDPRNAPLAMRKLSALYGRDA